MKITTAVVTTAIPTAAPVVRESTPPVESKNHNFNPTTITMQ